MARRRNTTDRITQDEKNPRKFKFSIGSLGYNRVKFTKEFDDSIDEDDAIMAASMWLTQWLDKKNEKKIKEIINHIDWDLA